MHIVYIFFFRFHFVGRGMKRKSIFTAIKGYKNIKLYINLNNNTAI